MIGRAHHLAEDHLFDCYVAERGGEPLDPPTAEHLADCLQCGGRYAELTAFMDGIRGEADAETEALFPADWRTAQQQSILRRIEHIGQAARVITFPGRLVARHITQGARMRVSPWPAAAAAACLFVGVAVGVFYDGRNRPTNGAAMRPASVQAAPALARESLDTDAFLTELERALGGSQIPALMSLDVLTPHVREISLNAR